ncbi:undecaprenyl diphosphate synthase family protein, partial [Klebsiella pneumoniae]|uniref:undecaprenyl diphosphate synthase family protein n=1 Tax=Klebsiella pneumoniae TaxID=573 RepID=UPI003EE27C4A
ADIVDLVERAETRTGANRGLTLIIALNYGSQNEIVAACRKLAVEAAAGRLDPAAIDAGLFASQLETADIPDPDLV